MSRDERWTKPESENAAWHEHNLCQLRYFRSLSLRARLESVEGMADVIRRFREMRKNGQFREIKDASGQN